MITARVPLAAMVMDGAPEDMITVPGHPGSWITADRRAPRAMPRSPRTTWLGHIRVLTPMCRTRPAMNLTRITGGTGMTTTGMTGTMMTIGGITAEAPASSTDRAGVTALTAGGSSSMAAAGCPMAGSLYTAAGTALTRTATWSRAGLRTATETVTI